MSDPHEVIKQLSPQDALSVLRALIDRDERIATLAAEIAVEQLSSIDPEAIAFELYDQLDALEVEEVWDRAGPTRHGYVDPGEAADQMVDEIVEPYLDRLKRFHALGMNAQANQLCKGLLWGLYRFERESTSGFKDWAPDASIGFAWAVLDAWKEGSPSKSDIQILEAFVENRLGGWGERYL